jgi:glycosyltransferase involved in cell wall biosynthesis
VDSLSPAPISPDNGASCQPPGGWPSVTVVVPTRDRPQLLHRAVRSILAQSFPGDIECVVVFDQSPPAALPVASSSGRRVRVLTNSRTPGLAGARNTGIESGDGSLIAFCDDDDAWDRDKLSRQVERLQSAEFAVCGVRVHHAGGVTVRLPPPEIALADLIRSRIAAMHPSTFVARRDSLTHIGLVDEKIPGSYGEDYDFLLRAARRGPIAAVVEPLVEVYWHSQSFFAEGWSTRASALEYLLDKHPEFASDRRGLARMQGRIAFAQAAVRQRTAACGSSWRAIRNNPAERRAYLALAVASGAVPATFIARLANRRGLGI